MFWPMRATFRENLVTKGYTYDKMLPKMHINEVSLQYPVRKYC
jgi:hypothetical protein